MRKSKELKRQRRQGGILYRKGNKAEAYKAWSEAAKGYQERSAKRQAKNAGGEAAAAP